MQTEKQQSDIRSQCHASVFQCVMRTCHPRLCGGANARGSSQTPDLLEGLRSLLKSQARATRMQHNLPFAISQEFSHASTAETILWFVSWFVRACCRGKNTQTNRTGQRRVWVPLGRSCAWPRGQRWQWGWQLARHFWGLSRANPKARMLGHLPWMLCPLRSLVPNHSNSQWLGRSVALCSRRTRWRHLLILPRAYRPLWIFGWPGRSWTPALVSTTCRGQRCQSSRRRGQKPAQPKKPSSFRLWDAQF